LFSKKSAMVNTFEVKLDATSKSKLLCVLNSPL